MDRVVTAFRESVKKYPSACVIYIPCKAHGRGQAIFMCADLVVDVGELIKDWLEGSPCHTLHYATRCLLNREGCKF